MPEQPAGADGIGAQLAWPAVDSTQVSSDAQICASSHFPLIQDSTRGDFDASGLQREPPDIWQLVAVALSALLPELPAAAPIPIVSTAALDPACCMEELWREPVSGDADAPAIACSSASTAELPSLCAVAPPLVAVFEPSGGTQRPLLRTEPGRQRFVHPEPSIKTIPNNTQKRIPRSLSMRRRTSTQERSQDGYLRMSCIFVAALRARTNTEDERDKCALA